MEERLRVQRREAEAAAERSVLDVAHLMRSGSARRRRTLFRAPRLPLVIPPNHAEVEVEKQVADEEDATDPVKRPRRRTAGRGARAIEGAEAHAAAERAAEERPRVQAGTPRQQENLRRGARRRPKAAAEEVEADAADVGAGSADLGHSRRTR